MTLAVLMHVHVLYMYLVCDLCVRVYLCVSVCVCIVSAVFKDVFISVLFVGHRLATKVFIGKLPDTSPFTKVLHLHLCNIDHPGLYCCWYSISFV